MLAKHRSGRKVCRVPRKIDAPGFALENFDVIGGWQTRYRSLNEEGDVVDKSQTYSGRRVPYTWGQPVDAAARRPPAEPLPILPSFKKLLLEDPRAIGAEHGRATGHLCNRCPDRVRRPGSRRDGAR